MTPDRWIPVPDALVDEIGALVPLEDRSYDRRVFPNLGDGALRDAMSRACRDAGTVHYSPHQLRHRRCSLWYAHIRDAVGLIRWSGHAKASMFLDVYSHVVLDSADDEWADFFRFAYANRAGGETPVVSRGEEITRNPAQGFESILQES